ncbi:hypothetical protein [Bacteroides acidifaciens]|uniref:hypothetical protein n=1 Tax=Bacteroides acidifaciens TaxID=85831 RepID=UPI002557DC45|nr:hypothetical protein [Bacteroides acidifaciens]
MVKFYSRFILGLLAAICMCAPLSVMAEDDNDSRAHLKVRLVPLCQGKMAYNRSFSM